MDLRTKKSITFLRAGMTALILSNLAHLSLRWTHGAGENFIDFTQGFFLAIAIGLLFLSMRSPRATG
ncbi:MAG TPA: hypothetical protein VER58_06945 [Thermoanaerobaculia bacterium]|nr:hypothetical protein [Thermoanaerobaculia bacterium]